MEVGESMSARILGTIVVSAHALLAACATAPPAPKTPAELIVGTWDCAVPAMTADSSYRLVFGKDGSLLYDFDGGIDELPGTRLTLTVAGAYETAGDALLVEMETADIKSATMDGELMAEDELEFFEEALVEGMNESLDSTFATQGSNGLILIGQEDPDFSLKCSRLSS